MAAHPVGTEILSSGPVGGQCYALINAVSLAKQIICHYHVNSQTLYYLL